jgi:plasmid stabilization system protein ParE
MAEVIITGPAKRDIRVAYEWWKENRSAEQADRWYKGILDASRSLGKKPERCTFAVETDLLAQGVRQLHYGLKRRPTHRIVFAIEDDTVVILRVRHASQNALTIDELKS